MEIVQGNYRIKLVADLPVWRTYYNGRLVASTNKAMWTNDSIDFMSKEAGEALLYTAMDLLSGMEEAADKTAVEDTEGSMVKTDDGLTKDVHPGETPEHAETAPEVEPSAAKVIIIKLQNLIGEAASMKAAGKDTTAIYAELDQWLGRFKEARRIALELELDSLVVKADQELNEGIGHVADTFRSIEKVVKEINGLG